MNTTNHNENNSDDHSIAVADELVAYLDGELTADESRRVEERLATDAHYRNQLQRMEKAWEMLDLLPTGQVDETFTRTTIEMITVAAKDDLHQTQILQITSRRRLYLYGVAAILTACVAGFLLTAKMIPIENDQLLQDLPVIEKIEMYEGIDNLADLENMISENLFLPEVDDEPE